MLQLELAQLIKNVVVIIQLTLSLDRQVNSSIPASTSALFSAKRAGISGNLEVIQTGRVLCLTTFDFCLMACRGVFPDELYVAWQRLL